MKKTFKLTAPGKQDARVVDSVKSEIRKYVGRETRKTPPEGKDTWDFACKVGYGDVAPASHTVPEMSKAIDAAVAAGSAEVYVEIIAVPGLRPPRPTYSSFPRPSGPNLTPVAAPATDDAPPAP